MRKKALLKSVFFVLLVVLLLPSAIGSAQAQDGTAIGSMVVDCSTLSGEALQFAHANAICPETVIGSTGGDIAADTGTSSGRCGTVSLTIENWPAPGQAIMSIRVVSTVGLITQLSYNIAWRNNDTGRVGAQSGGTPIHASTVYESPLHLVNTGRGIIRGVLTGQATVNVFLQCVFKPTIAFEIVT